MEKAIMLLEQETFRVFQRKKEGTPKVLHLRILATKLDWLSVCHDVVCIHQASAYNVARRKVGGLIVLNKLHGTCFEHSFW